MPGIDRKLSNKQELAAQALAMGERQVDIEKKQQIPTSTLRKWLANPLFKARTNVYREEILGEARDRFRAMYSTALNSLEGLLLSPDENVRLKAVRTILERVPLFDDKATAFIGHTDPVDLTFPGSPLANLMAEIGYTHEPVEEDEPYGIPEGGFTDVSEFAEYVTNHLFFVLDGVDSLDEVREAIGDPDLTLSRAKVLVSPGCEDALAAYVTSLWEAMDDVEEEAEPA